MSKTRDIRKEKKTAPSASKPSAGKAQSSPISALRNAGKSQPTKKV